MTREEEEEEEVALAKELKTSHEGRMDGLKMKSPDVSERRDRNLGGGGERKIAASRSDNF